MAAKDTIFQLASTPFTVTLKAIPAVLADAEPVLPLAEPGDAVSPGNNTCNLANVPALNTTELLATDVAIGVIPDVLAAVKVTVSAFA